MCAFGKSVIRFRRYSKTVYSFVSKGLSSTALYYLSMLHHLRRFLTTTYFNMRILLFLGLTFLIAAAAAADDHPLLGPPLALQNIFEISNDVT
jgi:hypothetical protein